MKKAKKIINGAIIAGEGTLGLGMVCVAVGAAKISALCAKGGMLLICNMVERGVENGDLAVDDRETLDKKLDELKATLAQL